MIDKKKESVLDALVCTTTIAEASKKTGVARSTIYKYMKDADFLEEYNNRRKVLLQENCRALQNEMKGAVKDLLQIRTDKTNSPQVRLNAIDMQLRHTYKLTEQCDILERLEALERLNEKE